MCFLGSYKANPHARCCYGKFDDISKHYIVKWIYPKNISQEYFPSIISQWLYIIVVLYCNADVMYHMPINPMWTTFDENKICLSF